MTKEQLNELGNALEILSAKSSFLQERADLRELYEDNLKTEAAAKDAGEDVDDQTVALGKRVRGMIKKMDKQLEERTPFLVVILSLCCDHWLQC